MSTGISTNLETPLPQKEIGQQYTQLAGEIEGLADAWGNFKNDIDPVLGPPSETKISNDSAKNPQPKPNISPLANDIRAAHSQVHDLKIDIRETLDRMEL